MELAICMVDVHISVAWNYVISNFKYSVLFLPSCHSLTAIDFTLTSVTVFASLIPSICPRVAQELMSNIVSNAPELKLVPLLTLAL